MELGFGFVDGKLLQAIPHQRAAVWPDVVHRRDFAGCDIFRELLGRIHIFELPLR